MLEKSNEVLFLGFDRLLLSEDQVLLVLHQLLVLSLKSSLNDDFSLNVDLVDDVDSTLLEATGRPGQGT